MTKTFTIQMTVEVRAPNMDSAVETFRDRYLNSRLPSMEVRICECTESEWADKSASELEYWSTPKRRFVWRSKEQDNFKEALDDGAIYLLPEHIPTHVANEMLRLAEKCIGSDCGMVVKEW
jgi:hypothetical protein